ncbi:VWFA domain-containing protein [Caenorhabditis elegans]|uniref:VWFA domain-containing protein n=1 Tax=Caenorhabditis elegans TaxID=6239 RepID=Q21394_CAEEL|nr:VWFA domain-containing protein [Caenorhabditis elegans]CCD69321.2 VWFA domain-containing protein [Caenorhabditis elegans]
MLFRVFSFCVFASFWRFVVTIDLQKEGICPPVLDIIILFDTSGGNDTVFEQQKNWTIKIVRDLPIHEDAVRVGLVQYSESAKTEFNLSKYSERNDIIAHMETLTFMQVEDTRTGVALNKADEEIFDFNGGARLKATRLIIIFTDGLSMDKPSKAAKALRRKGVKIYTISVNSIGFIPEMLGIVGDADNVFGPNDEERIEERLLGEVEHSRSCDVQPKRNEKTTSSFGLKVTQFGATSFIATEISEKITTSTQDPPTLLTSAITPTLNTESGFLSSPSSPISSLSSWNAVLTLPDSEENDSDNSVEDIGRKEPSSTNPAENITASSLPTSILKEPVQLFTVETLVTEQNEVQNLTNLKTSLAEDSNSNTSETHNKNETSERLVKESFVSEGTSTTPSSTTFKAPPESEITEITVSNEINEASTTSSPTPAATTICISPPTTTQTSSSASSSPHSSTKSFLAKLGVKHEKEKDSISKFLGRDVSNSNSVKEVEEINENEFGNSSFGESDGKTTPLETSSSSSTSQRLTTTTKSSTTSPFATRFVFSTRVTFRPVSSTVVSTKSSTTSSTTTKPTTLSTTTTTQVPSTTTSVTVPSTQKATPSPSRTTKKSTTTTSTTATPRQATPTRNPLPLLQTMSAITAFPTLLSMEKAVTLPINNALGVSKPIKKKIRRIIKRRRNILPFSLARKVTNKVLEVRRVPTPTTPPIRSTLRPIIIEEKEEETLSSAVQCPMDILFVVDSSGSITHTYDTQKDYLTQLIKKVEPSRSHRVGLIQFAGPHIQKMEWSFDTHSKNSQLLSAIRSVRHLTGTTYIGAALELSLILLDSRRKHTETTVILISDGFSQDDSTQQAKLLRQLPNVKMYAISLNKLTNTKYLTDIVGDRKNLFINNESTWFEEFFTKKLRCIPTTR